VSEVKGFISESYHPTLALTHWKPKDKNSRAKNAQIEKEKLVKASKKGKRLKTAPDEIYGAKIAEYFTLFS